MSTAPKDGTETVLDIAANLNTDSLIDVPNGANIVIQSSLGGPYTMTRKNGFTDSFFKAENGGKLTIIDVTLDGNGSNVTAAAPIVYINNTGEFTMDGAAIQNVKGNVNFGLPAGVYVCPGGTMTMKNGSVIEDVVNLTAFGAFYVAGTLNMEDSYVINCTGINCGGVALFGIFNMSGSSAITGNIGDFGGVMLSTASIFNLSGAPEISGNKKTNGTTSCNVFFGISDRIINVVGTLSNTTPIGVTSYTAVTKSSPATITAASGQDWSGYFTSDNPSYKIRNSGRDSSQVVQLAASTTINVSDSSGSHLPTGVTYDSVNKIFKIDTGNSLSVITVTGDNSTSHNTIAVAAGVSSLVLILNDVSITGISTSPIELQGDANVGIWLADGTTNTLDAHGAANKAGLCVPSTATAVIDGSTGSLEARGGNSGAGIGGGAGGSSGDIINAQLDNSISDTDDSYLKCNSSVLKLPATYTCFAFNVSTASAVSAYSNSGCTALLGSIVTNPAGLTSIPVTDLGTSPANVTDVMLQTSYTATATVNKDGSAWTSGTPNIKLYTSSSSLTGEVTGTGLSSSVSNTPAANNNTIVIVDDKDYSIGTENKNGVSTTATVDQSKLTNEISKASENSSVVFPVSDNSSVTAQLVVKNIEDMAKKDMTLTVQTGKVSYNINTSAIDTEKITEALGTTDSKSIPFNVVIANSSVAVNGTTVVVAPVEFTITATYNGKTVNIDTFNSFVERAIEITAEQAEKITTAVVVEQNGSLRHVPTYVYQKDGKWYAKINSLTNSTYTLIWHPQEFTDVEKHWAENAVNDMGSIMVVSGIGNNKYAPDRAITRAEFAAIIVRALGLAPGKGKSGFNDVEASKRYCGYIETASAYGIIKGYNTTTFGPNDKITREQAMTMIARAMKITGLETELKDSESLKILMVFSDSAKVSAWAKSSMAACVKAGIVSGKGGNSLAPKDEITRAEVAAIVQRLLQKSGLIQE